MIPVKIQGHIPSWGAGPSDGVAVETDVANAVAAALCSIRHQACRERHGLVTLRTLKALSALDTLNTLVTLIAFHALDSLDTLVALVTFLALDSLDALDTLVTLVALWPNGTNC